MNVCNSLHKFSPLVFLSVLLPLSFFVLSIDVRTTAHLYRHCVGMMVRKVDCVISATFV